MNGSMKKTGYRSFEIREVENKPVAEKCNFSGFSMAAVAGSLLLCLGIIVYAILTV